jgi:flagellar hook-basal body complex protein FliE
MAEINGVQVPFVPIVTDQEVSGNKVKAGTGFESIFERELEKIKFSNHAAKRLESRDIQLSETDLNKLQSAVGKAEEKVQRTLW